MRGLASIPFAFALLFATSALAGGEEPSPTADDPNPLAYKGPAVFDPAMLGREIPILEGWDMINYRDLPPPTSDCFGDPVTPKCALDTLLSCWIRNIQTHCDAVGLNTSVYPNYLRRVGVVYQFYVTYYQVEFTRALTEENIPAWAYERGWRSGDLLVANYSRGGQIDASECSFLRDETASDCERVFRYPPATYLLVIREEDEGWRYIDRSGIDGRENFQGVYNSLR